MDADRVGAGTLGLTLTDTTAESGTESLLLGHTLEDQIGGQITAGLPITGFYEDDNGG